MPPGVQSKFHTWSRPGNQLENPSSIFTSRLHSISSSYYPPLTHISSFHFIAISFLSGKINFPSLSCLLLSLIYFYTYLTLCRPVNVDTSTLFTLSNVHMYMLSYLLCNSLLSRSHIPICYKIHTKTDINIDNFVSFHHFLLHHLIHF